MSGAPGLSDIPCPPGLPLVGHLFTLDRGAIIQSLMALARDLGPIFQLDLLGRSIVFVSGPSLVEEVCDPDRFQKSLKGKLGEMRKVVGDGLLTVETRDPAWRRAHEILLPNFRQSEMHSYHAVMCGTAEQLLLKWERLNPGDDIDLVHDMTALTFEVIGVCGFGYRFNSFYHDRSHAFVEALVAALDLTMRAKGLPYEDLFYWRRARRLKSCIRTMNDLVDRIIQERERSDDGHKDLLSYMLAGKDKRGEGLDRTNIRNQIITFLGAGHETTSGLLSFALLHLLGDHTVMSRCREEIDRVLGRVSSNAVTYEQIRHLVYVRQALKETLRLWPTAPAISVEPRSDTVIGGRYALKQGQQVSILLTVLHRDKTAWGENAEAFDPENFSSEKERARPAHHYKPFGIGERACIGQQFAMHEATLVLAMILQRFDLSLADPHYRLKLRETLSIKPDGLRILAKPRPTPTAKARTSSPAAQWSVVETPPFTKKDHATPLLALFGSNMGTSEEIARRIAAYGEAAGFATTVAPLDAFAERLPTTGTVVIVSSSYNGLPPDNATAFCDWLKSGRAKQSKLASMAYAVFGCGNSDWAQTFQAVPRLIDERLITLGARRICERGEGDMRLDFDGELRAWQNRFYAGLAESMHFRLPADKASKPPLFTIEISSPHRGAVPATIQPSAMAVRTNCELQCPLATGRTERSTRHIEVELPEGVTYRAGDHFGVVPRNDPALVRRVAARFGLQLGTMVRLQRADGRQAFVPTGEWIAAGELLACHADLQAPATRGQIEFLAEHAACPSTRERLTGLARAGAVADAPYAVEVLAKRRSVFDLLEEFPACELPFHVYLETCAPLVPRYYSISSSPLASPRTISLTVAVLEAPARSGKGSYRGTCSNYLASLVEGERLHGFVKDTKSAFRLPVDEATPLIMVGPGTGLAPFRGFLQERAALRSSGKMTGPAMLFFGCRHPERDFIYRSELDQFAASGVVDLHTAFSRTDDGRKAYVQDAILAAREGVWNLLKQGGVVYVCGDATRMAPNVKVAFARLYQSMSGSDTVEAEQWLEQMIRDERYLADVWA